MESVAGVEQQQAWAAPALREAGVLHTAGSIIEIIQHCATCKVMYASAAFRNAEVDWLDCAERLDTIGPDRKGNLDYLES